VSGGFERRSYKDKVRHLEAVEPFDYPGMPALQRAKRARRAKRGRSEKKDKRRTNHIIDSFIPPVPHTPLSQSNTTATGPIT